MYMTLLVFHVIISLLLIAAVLIQSGKGSSLSNIFGGGGMETVFGAETPSILNKITSILAILFMVMCVLLATLPGKLTTGSILQRGVKQDVPAPASTPVSAPVSSPVPAPATPPSGK